MEVHVVNPISKSVRYSLRYCAEPGIYKVLGNNNGLGRREKSRVYRSPGEKDDSADAIRVVY